MLSQKTLIGIYKADGGLAGELSYFFGHLIGVRHCSLCDITHSPVKKKREFKELERRLEAEFGIGFRLLHMNERTAEEERASSGREPCVLLQHEDGTLSMFLDFMELQAVDGSVKSFEKLLRTRLDLFI
ncbi:MAG: hypothetical protein RIR89_990 [Actinomycetota bacterium]|jgi:hypothetical protein